MMTVTREQLQALADAGRGQFIARMQGHLPAFFPEKCAELGEGGLRQAVEHGVARAALHGIESEYGVCLYLYVMMRLGSTFDEDPALDIARQVLARPGSPVHNVESLFDLVFWERRPTKKERQKPW